MKIIGMQDGERNLTLRYETTWNLGWENILDIMQVFFDDISSNIESVAYFPIAGATPVPVTEIIDGLLHKTKVLQKERGGLFIIGISKAYNKKIGLIAYNQLKFIDVQIPKTETDLVAKLKQDHNLLETYMNSLEINGYARDAKRRAFNLYGRFVSRVDGGDDKFIDLLMHLSNECNKVGAEPFPDTVCKTCNHAFKNRSNGTAKCPRCGSAID